MADGAIEEWALLGPIFADQLVADQAAKSPDALALVTDVRTLTNRAWEHRANRLAESLAGSVFNPTPSSRFVGRVPLVIGALQILKAAGASLPVDPGYPQAHISHILADAKVPVAEGPFLDIK